LSSRGREAKVKWILYYRNSGSPADKMWTDDTKYRRGKIWGGKNCKYSGDRANLTARSLRLGIVMS